jgi:hypothetical protein
MPFLKAFGLILQRNIRTQFHQIEVPLRMSHLDILRTLGGDRVRPMVSLGESPQRACKHRIYRQIWDNMVLISVTRNRFPLAFLTPKVKIRHNALILAQRCHSHKPKIISPLVRYVVPLAPSISYQTSALCLAPHTRIQYLGMPLDLLAEVDF